MGTDSSFNFPFPSKGQQRQLVFTQKCCRASALRDESHAAPNILSGAEKTRTYIKDSGNSPRTPG